MLICSAIRVPRRRYRWPSRPYCRRRAGKEPGAAPAASGRSKPATCPSLPSARRGGSPLPLRRATSSPHHWRAPMAAGRTNSMASPSPTRRTMPIIATTPYAGCRQNRTMRNKGVDQRIERQRHRAAGGELAQLLQVAHRLRGLDRGLRTQGFLDRRLQHKPAQAARHLLADDHEDRGHAGSRARPRTRRCRRQGSTA